MPEKEHVFRCDQDEVKIMGRDRGTMKWASLMLPEHVKLLQHIWREDIKVNKPELDGQELALMNDENEKVYLQMADGNKEIISFKNILSLIIK